MSKFLNMPDPIFFLTLPDFSTLCCSHSCPLAVPTPWGQSRLIGLCLFPHSFHVLVLRKGNVRWFQFCLWEQPQGESQAAATRAPPPPHPCLVLQPYLFYLVLLCSLLLSGQTLSIYDQGEEEQHLESHTEGASWSVAPTVDCFGKW